MKFDLSRINYGPGNIEFNDIELITDEPLVNQLDYLKEDLLQVSYVNGLLLDVGWYPSFDKHGKFQIKIIVYNDWERPKYYSEAESIDRLISEIKTAVSIIEKINASTSNL